MKLDDIAVNDNKEFVRCDKLDCEEKGYYPKCYFDIYKKCDNYEGNNKNS
jgi:hypothetical protein